MRIICDCQRRRQTSVINQYIHWCSYVLHFCTEKERGCILSLYGHGASFLREWNGDWLVKRIGSLYFFSSQTLFILIMIPCANTYRNEKLHIDSYRISCQWYADDASTQHNIIVKMKNNTKHMDSCSSCHFSCQSLMMHQSQAGKETKEARVWE